LSTVGLDRDVAEADAAEIGMRRRIPFTYLLETLTWRELILFVVIACRLCRHLNFVAAFRAIWGLELGFLALSQSNDGA
jgi:hypothetical protein